jgi:hypothetical protein
VVVPLKAHVSALTKTGHRAILTNRKGTAESRLPLALEHSRALFLRTPGQCSIPSALRAG